MMTRPHILTAAVLTTLGLAAGCAATVGTDDTDSAAGDTDSVGNDTTSSTGTETPEECEGTAPECPPFPGSCDDEREPAICIDGSWECPFAQLPPGEEFRCSTDTNGPGSVSSTSPTGDSDPSTTTGDSPDELQADVLFVVDNSSNTAPLQQTLAAGAAGFLQALEDAGVTDAHLMVTSTDMGNPACDPFAPEGYEPLAGQPESASCRDRLQRFEPLGGGGESQATACTDVCAEGSGIDGPFLTLREGQSNGTPTAADALGCLIPQGVQGCGYEQPMEAMLRALDPEACWNAEGGCSGADEPFLREEAALLVVVLTDEGDCSVEDVDAMFDTTYQSTDPETGEPLLTSAWCFNAGMDCDAEGNCELREDSPLYPTARYAEGLAALRASGKHVGVALLAGLDAGEQVRSWTDDDLFEDEISSGETPAHLQFAFGPAPSCRDEQRRTRALPTPRMQAALCGDEPCVVASACAANYDEALATLPHTM